MWASMASTFKNDPNVVLGPWASRRVNPQCYLAGGLCEASHGRAHRVYVTAGMQQAVNVMRSAGGTGGRSPSPANSYANNLSQWLTFEPRDPAAAADRRGARLRQEPVQLDVVLRPEHGAGCAARAADLRGRPARPGTGRTAAPPRSRASYIGPMITASATPRGPGTPRVTARR